MPNPRVSTSGSAKDSLQRRLLSELLDLMGRRTPDVEASDLLIQAAQEVKEMELAIIEARDFLRYLWSNYEFKRNGADAVEVDALIQKLGRATS